MTDLDEQRFAPPRLPGAVRARTFPEPTETDSVLAEPLAAQVTVDERPILTPALVAYRPAPPAPDAAMFGRRRHVVRILSFGLAKPKPGQEEQEYRKNNLIIKEAAWGTSQRIAVVSPKGGIGKTPTALILAGILATQRGGSVAVWDACDAAGTLHSRAGGHQLRCVSEIALHPDQFPDPATISTAAATQNSYADVLASLHEREFDDASVRAITGVLDHTYKLQVADTGNTPHSSAYKAVLKLADILVIPTSLTADSINKALGLILRLQADPTNPAQRAVVILSHFGGPVTVAEAHELFKKAGVGAVIDVPFDPHIDAGVEIDPAKLSHASRLAWTRGAATVISNIA